jgi:hypothetical protein
LKAQIAEASSHVLISRTTHASACSTQARTSSNGSISALPNFSDQRVPMASPASDCSAAASAARWRVSP